MNNFFTSQQQIKPRPRPKHISHSFLRLLAIALRMCLTVDPQIHGPDINKITFTCKGENLMVEKISWWGKPLNTNVWLSKQHLISIPQNSLFNCSILIHKFQKQAVPVQRLNTICLQKKRHFFISRAATQITGPLKFLHYLFCTKLGKSLGGKSLYLEKYC